ncbi:hypothetical protein CONLIGDRAFT_638134 [Coniochaeta ligniaria NRRL 30616]|uniref:Secreted protein n=1 Tax=Coniochaeta ligniaria NRRL 30616 TaxID=1408157 RepID=A0A1J7I5N7_9PEZI|nr:hypothetical protein CONLIGDRAFT_638134 [Coniochaeta ligniaria NRRL 30616]
MGVTDAFLAVCLACLLPVRVTWFREVEPPGKYHKGLSHEKVGSKSTLRPSDRACARCLDVCMSYIYVTACCEMRNPHSRTRMTYIASIDPSSSSTTYISYIYHARPRFANYSHKDRPLNHHSCQRPASTQAVPLAELCRCPNSNTAYQP